MKQIKLVRMHLENFKCYKDRVIDFGDRTIISGMNGIGKTTIADAVSWVLFDKMSNGSQAKNIRPHTKDGSDIDFINITVELDFMIDEKKLNIKKVQKQKWTKPRGQEEKRFDGNYNEYELNTIPKSEKEFKLFWNSIIEEDVFKLVSNASGFISLNVKDKRKKLFELIPDFQLEDVLESDEKLKEGLSELLDQFTIEELKSRNAKALKEYKKHINEIPSRIDEVHKSIVDIDVEELEEQKNCLKEQILDIENKESDLSSQLESVLKMQDEALRVQNEIGEYANKANMKLLQDKRAAQEEYNAASNRTYNLFTAKKEKEREIDDTKNELNNLADNISNLVNELNSVREEKMDENSLICPTCGQELPASEREKVVREFDVNKKKRLDAINANGKDLNIKRGMLNKSLEQMQLEFDDLKTKWNEATCVSNKAYEYLNQLPADVDLSENQEYKALQDKLSNLKQQLSNIDDGMIYRKQLQNNKNKLLSELEEVNRKLSSADANVKAEERIAVLEQTQKELRQQVADAEREQYLIELFERKKIELLTDKINSHFKIVRWVLFEQQINGGYKEVCVPQVGGSKYGEGLNSGHMILAELDIVNTMQEIYKISTPVFLDNAERLSDNNIPDTSSQIIELRVSNDKELKVEVTE